MHVIDSAYDDNFFIQWRMFPPVPEEDGDESEAMRDLAMADEEREVLPDSDGVLRVVGVLRNSITIHHNSFSEKCFPHNPVPCGLKVVDCDPNIIEYEEEDENS